jgi:hypothetical protein
VELRIFDSFLDPVVIVNGAGILQYANPVTIRWLGLVDGFGIVGEPITKYVEFRDSEALDSIATLRPLENSSYHLTHFKLMMRKYESYAKVCMLRLPDQGEVSIYLLIIRDREFIKGLLDEDDFKLKASLEKFKQNPIMQIEEFQGLTTEVRSDSVILSEASIVSALPQDRRAKLECIANLFFIDIAKAAIGNTTHISDQWIEMIIRPIPNLKVGIRVNLEVVGNVQMRGFSTVGELKQIFPHGQEIEIRIAFGTISTLSRRALDEFLEIHMQHI